MTVTDTRTTVLTYDEVPPSSNRNSGVGGRGHPQSIAQTKRRWQEIFGWLLLQARVPKNLKRVEVDAELQFKDKRRRDSDNFYFAIAKPLGDALVKGGWLSDDTSDLYAFNRVRICNEPLVDRNTLVKGRLTLVLRYET